MVTAEAIDAAWKRLKRIDSEIRRFHPGDVGGPGFDESLRNLTANEWEEIERIIKTSEFPCRLATNAYGFFLVVHAYGMIRDIQTDALLVISSGQFPFPSAKEGFTGQEETLRRLSHITHRLRNKELLEFHGFEDLHSAEFYAY